MRKKNKQIEKAERERKGREEKFFLTKQQHEFLTMNQQSGNAQVKCDLCIVFSQLLCIESQEYFSQHFVLEKSLATGTT